MRLLVPRLLFKSRIRLVQCIRSNSQHRVILLPIVPPDTPENNPILRRYKNDGLLDYRAITEKNCYFGLGKAILEFETQLSELEKECLDSSSKNERDFKTLFSSFEKEKNKLEGIRDTVSLLLMTTDSLHRSVFVELDKRVQKAFSSLFASDVIYKTLVEMKDCGKINESEEIKIVNKYLCEYKHQGFELTEKKNRHLKSNYFTRLNEALGNYATKITRATSSYHQTITDSTIVKNFPDDVLRAMTSNSYNPLEGPWISTFHPYIHRKFLEYCPDRSLRWGAYSSFVQRGIQDNYNVHSEIKEIKMQRKNMAVYLGYENYMEFSLVNSMAGSITNLETMISILLPKARLGQERELDRLQAFAEKTGFEDELLEYDIPYFNRVFREAELGLTDEDLRNFFPFPKVLEGLFVLLEEFFGLKIEKDSLSKECSAWNSDVELYRIVNGSSVLGRFYIDPYIRDDKGFAGGDKGWYLPLRNRSKIAGTSPIGSLVFSFPNPTNKRPSCLNLFEVEEVFRLFGTLLSHQLCNNEWSELNSSQNMEKDCSQFVQEFMVHWLYTPTVLSSVSRHVVSGASLPNKLSHKILSSSTPSFILPGLHLCEELYKSATDLQFHSLGDEESYDEISSRLRSQYLLIPPDSRDAFPKYFTDILSQSSPGSYYKGIWSAMLAADAFYAIIEAKEKNENISSIGQRFKSIFLEKAASASYRDKFREFRGRDPTHEALLYHYGLKD